MVEQSTEAIVVLLTAGSREEAARLADMLVGSRLAACVQIMAEMESVYHWQGQIERAPEILLLAKTTPENFAELEREVRALHSYETPEIVALPVTDASAPYLAWLAANVLRHRQDEESEASTNAAGDSQAQEP
ncbi:MAG: periplasmic divalent cation tolerance protein [Blastocatellia bacterium]|jgi:periplasmic divalent cation tolerance protein|nr:periplasmic divalent cation tolerance protein [Blastocatellia bacterium]